MMAPPKILTRMLQPELGFVGFTLLAFVVWNAFFGQLQASGFWTLMLATPLAAILCTLAPGPRFADVIKPVRIVACVIAVLMGLYGVLASITYPTGISPEHDLVLQVTRISSLFALAAGLVSFKWPALVFLPAVFVAQQKATSVRLFDLRISHTDYIPVLEMGLFLGLGLMLLGSGLPRRLGPVSRMLGRCDIPGAMVLLFMAATAAHFSNYLYSGIQKIVMDGGLWLWALDNPTHILSANAWLGGSLPTAAFPALSAQLMIGAETMRPVLNILILAAQLAAVLFLIRRVALIAGTLFYDLTHVTIYLVSGIMFWKWIILNTALVAAMRHLTPDAERPRAIILAVLMVLLAPQFFHIVRLGWYDTPALTRTEITAVAKSGDTYQVPSNFFGTISVTAAQHRLGRVEDGHFPTLTWGTTQRAQVQRVAQEGCQFDQGPRRFATTQANVARLLQLTQSYADQQAANDGRYKYNVYPHHIWSSPLIDREFAMLDPRDIDFYVYKTISSCVSLKDGYPVEDIRHTDQFKVPARP